RGPPDGRACPNARRDLDGRGVHGRADLYRQRAQFHDLRHRDRARGADAELLRLHGVVVRGAAAGLRAGHLFFFLEALAERLAPRAFAGFALFAGGSTAIASISNRAPGRASCEIATAVLAGRGILKNWSRSSRKIVMCDMSVRKLVIFTQCERSA